jgi:hypothetical protein
MSKGMIKVFFVLIFTVELAYSQSTISGKVLDQSSKKPIAYANIGIVNTNVGTISNEDGTFALKVPNQYAKETLLFSAIGFVKKSVPVKSILSADLTILLEEQVIQLKEVTIASTKEKNKHFELGNSICKGGVLETDTTYAGASIALLIENNNPYHEDLIFPVYLEQARIRIYRNNLTSFKLRIRIYSVDSLTNQPSEDLFDRSLVMESSMKNGWMEFDLSPFKYLVSRPFFIAFERILTQSDRAAVAKGYQEFKRDNPDDVKIDTILFEGKKIVREIYKGGGIDLPGTFIGIATSESARQHTCYTRKTSFDKWEKVRGILSATVILSNQLE